MGKWLWLLVLLGSLSGCENLDLQEKTQTVLRPAQMSQDSVGLEIVFIRCKLDDPEINQQLWGEVDEQQLPAGLRKQLDENGFRVGIVGSSTPRVLQRLMKGEPQQAVKSPVEQASIAKMDGESIVTGRHLQVRTGQPSEIQTSQVYEELPLLLRKEGQVVGQMLKKAQGVLIVKAYPTSGGAVRLEIIPQFQYGDPVQSIAPSDEGVWKFEAARKREIFDQLLTTATLQPGQYLILACRAEQPASLGHHFFTLNSTGTVEQKLLLIRIGQTQHSDL